MEMSPQTVRSTAFSVVKRGYDPDEVDAFKDQVAAAVEFSQNQATAMEARARAAVAKLQEVSQQVADAQRDAAAAAAVAAAPAPAAAVAVDAAPSADAEVISRTLLLAQKTADATVAEARLEAEQVVQGAREEAARLLEQASSSVARAADEARAEARRAGEQERLIAENEVQSLLARRDFLLADVEQLEQYVQSQRERLREAANTLFDMVDRVPAGLGEMRRPLLSASGGVLDPAVAAAIAAPVVQADHAPATSVDGAAAAAPVAPPLFEDQDITSELPVVPPAVAPDQFRIGGEELQ